MILEMIPPGISQSQTSDLKFSHLSTEQGLSQDIVSAIVQDKQGFMWFATENGLNRYDGYSIKVYKHNQRDSTSLAANDVGKLLLDRSGTLWVFQSGVISTYDPDRDAFTNIHIDFGTYCAYDDRRSHLLLGTTRGLMALSLRDHSITTLYPETSVGTVHSLCESVQGFVWAGTSNGLYRYEPGSGKISRQGNIAVTDGISRLLEDSRGRLWYNASDHGLRRFNIASKTIDEFVPDLRDPKSPLAGVIFCLFEDRRGSIWVGTFSGLDMYDSSSGGFIHYRPDPDDPYSLRSSRVYSVFQDRDGALWIGTYRGGVSKFDPYQQKFEHFHSGKANSRGPVGTNVFALLETSSGDFWIGTENGLARVDRNSHRFTSFLSDRGLGQTTALAEDRKGRLWVGSQAGLICYDAGAGTVKRYRHSENESSSIGEDDVQSLFLDREGTLWVGLKGRGLNRYNEGNDAFTRFLPGDGNPILGIWDIMEDHRGVLWLGSRNIASGVYCLEKSTGVFTIPGQSKVGSRSAGVPSVRAVYEDSNGAFWLGSWGGGIYRFDPDKQTLTQFTEADGLVNDFVKGMLADDRENLWISTENGLSRFDPATGTFKNFTEADGLQSNFFWTGSFFKGRNGWMYFGGTNGFNAFHPDSIKDNPNIPPIVITRFTVLNEPTGFAWSHDIHLRYDQDFFSFDFVALNYTAPEKNTYAYMMEGFDKEWVNAGTRRYAAYTHLDPGQYTFKVKAANNDGIWNEQGVSVSIVILPPYWRTWWFLLLVALTLAGGLTAAYLYRVRNLIAIERLRSRIAADLHDEVGSNLSSIAIASQLIGKKISLPDNERLQLAEIGTTALRTAEMMKEIVWLLNPNNDLVDDLLLKMKAVAGGLLQNIPYTFVGPQQRIMEKVNLETKRNLYMMYKEILNNVVLHASATGVSILVGWEGRRFSLVVKDNGRGFNVDAPPQGNGLRNLRARSERIGGALSIVSTPSGTTVSVELEIT